MKDSFATRLHNRELYDPAPRFKSYRKLYSAPRLIKDLDIVNELDGHSGCVNALSWSRSGALLASGSDDQHLNIHRYQPEDAAEQFQLQATIATGHTQNIFSVKFMPHSNDRTLISAAGDAQVRVFDLEHQGGAGTASAASVMASEGRRRGRNNLYNGVRYLSDGDTHARVYRSHGDRVKRIITESSPHLFLTCSEDGEVRQWDLRQPSSAYPEPRGGRMTHDSSVPPPLISYKRYALDLNTISCTASQPHYIALGGAHLHAFLHDRRMTGRDKLKEMGKPLAPINSLSQNEQELLSQATQCVRKFAPNGEQKMKRADRGHITACKISDARPDEMIVSWSGDHIYSFDLIRDPESQSKSSEASKIHRAKESTDRKRKRPANGSETSLGHEARASSRPRTEGVSNAAEDTALRIRYQNGQSEDIALPSRPPLSQRELDAQAIAKSTLELRSALFNQQGEASDQNSQFTNALGHAARLLGDIDAAIGEWTYPMAPEPSQVRLQHLFREGRERTRRFTQASGTLARVSGGRLQTTSGSSALLAKFSKIEIRSSELLPSTDELFAYDFLKAILIWLDSGVGQLVEAFTRPSSDAVGHKFASRLPIPEDDATVDSIDEYLIPYLTALATDESIINVEANRFEVEENRQVFRSGKDAVRAFAAAVRIPFEDLSSTAVQADEAEAVRSQDRQTALRFWARKVGRGLLLTAAEGLSYKTVDRSFGGTGKVSKEILRQEARLDLLTGAEAEDEEAFAAVEIIDEGGEVIDGANAEDVAAAAAESRRSAREAENEDHDQAMDDDDDSDENNDEEGNEDDEDDSDADSSESSEPDEEDGVPNISASRYIYRSAVERRKLRPKVEANVPCFGPTRTYRGHCNVRTVKDVNYFGPDDEYVVSGSDDGNFFIWDRKTTELLNILEGDGEVVNVIQGHPYETMLAVSGIDHTIKIFSPDARARQTARLGQGVSAADASSFSSLAWPMRAGRRPRRRTAGEDSTSEPAVPARSAEQQSVDDDEEYVAPQGLRSRRRIHDAYRITQSNNRERVDGSQGTMISIPHAQLLQLLFGQLGNVGFDFE